MNKSFRNALFACLAIFPSHLAVAAEPVDPIAIERAAQRREQDIGRILAAPSGNSMFYEWSRPYGWRVPASRSERALAARPRTLLYKVVMPIEPRDTAVPTSEYLVSPRPGATYWLGNLSPDEKWISFYELDWDKGNSARAGIVEVKDSWVEPGETSAPPRIIWFSLPPDKSRLDHPPAWSPDGTTLTYPVEGGVASGNVATGNAERCNDCAEPPFARQGQVPVDLAAGIDRRGVPGDAQLAAVSDNGVLGIFLSDNKDHLNLYYRRRDRLVTLFENQRK